MAMTGPETHDVSTEPPPLETTRKARPWARRGARAAAVFAVAFAITVLAGWLAAPVLLGIAVDRGLRDLHRHYELTGSRGVIVRSGFGFEMRDLSIADDGAAPLLSVGLLRVKPAPAWPPAVLEVDALHVSREGFQAYERTLGSGGRSWFKAARSGVRRQHRNLRGAAPRAVIRDAVIEIPEGSIRIDRGVLRFSAPEPTRAVATLRGEIRLERAPPDGTDDPGAHANLARADAAVEISQDAVSVRLQLELDGEAPVVASRRAAAPGWRGVVPAEASWSPDEPAGTPNSLAKRLLGW